jgi:hypothetical protein
MALPVSLITVGYADAPAALRSKHEATVGSEREAWPWQSELWRSTAAFLTERRRATGLTPGAGYVA